MSNISLPYQLTKTLLCALYEMQATSKVDALILPNTTLNFKYNNNPNVLPEESIKLAYFGIGTRGYRNLNDENLSAPYIPSAKNMDLFQPLPFRVVPISNDLSPAEKLKYRMRVLKVVDGVQYWCYYLKKISFIDNRVNIIETDLTTNTETILSELDQNDLNPVPLNTTAEGISTATSKISVALTATVQITGEEVIEAINVLYGGNLLRAAVSEIGIYMGNDQTVVMNDGVGGTFNGTEAIFTSLAYHYTSLPVPFSNPARIENIALRINSSSAFLI